MEQASTFSLRIRALLDSEAMMMLVAPLDD